MFRIQRSMNMIYPIYNPCTWYSPYLTLHAYDSISEWCPTLYTWYACTSFIILHAHGVLRIYSMHVVFSVYNKQFTWYTPYVTLHAHAILFTRYSCRRYTCSPIPIPKYIQVYTDKHFSLHPVRKSTKRLLNTQNRGDIVVSDQPIYQDTPRSTRTHTFFVLTQSSSNADKLNIQSFVSVVRNRDMPAYSRITTYIMIHQGLN